MNFLASLPYLVLIPLAVGFGTQIIKGLVETRGRLTLQAIDSYGGMPSTHAAITVSLVTVIGLDQGIQSPVFAIATITAIIVIRDAIGFRRYLGSHGHALNLMVKELPTAEQSRFHRFRERLGHTPLEVFVGAVVGFCSSAALYLALMPWIETAQR